MVHYETSLMDVDFFPTLQQGFLHMVVPDCLLGDYLMTPNHFFVFFCLLCWYQGDQMQLSYQANNRLKRSPEKVAQLL